MSLPLQILSCGLTCNEQLSTCSSSVKSPTATISSLFNFTTVCPFSQMGYKAVRDPFPSHPNTARETAAASTWADIATSIIECYISDMLATYLH